VLLRRSGAPSRFLVFRSPEYWAIRSELLVFNFIFGFLPFFGMIFGFSVTGGTAALALLDPLDPIHRLARPVSRDEAAAGAERLGGRIAGGDLCLVTHENHSGKNWSEDFHKAQGEGASIRIEHAEGAGAPRPGELLIIDWSAADWSRAEWEPRVFLRASSREAMWRKKLPAMPSGGRVLEGCLHRGDRIFVDVPPKGPGPTYWFGPARSAPMLTPGDGTARLRLAEVTASRAGMVSLLALAALLILLGLWRLARARPIADALVQRLRQPLVPTASPSTLFVLAATPLVLLGALWASRLFDADGPAAVERWGWAGAHFAVAIAVVVAVRMGDRRAALGAAMREVGPPGAAAPPLDRAREGERFGVDATVGAAAPLSPAPLSGKPHAHWVVRVTSVYKSGRNYASAHALDVSGPLVVPISRDGHAALLDLGHVAADLRAVHQVARPRALRHGKYRDIVGQAFAAGTTYVLEERFLEPGEPVHVIARVARFEQRDAGPTPVLAGTASEPVIVHAGSRRSLLRGLAVERAFLSAALPLCLALGLGVAALSVYLLGV
jgi:hypothetical protein